MSYEERLLALDRKHTEARDGIQELLLKFKMHPRTRKLMHWVLDNNHNDFLEYEYSYAYHSMVSMYDVLYRIYLNSKDGLVSGMCFSSMKNDTDKPKLYFHDIGRIRDELQITSNGKMELKCIKEFHRDPDRFMEEYGQSMLNLQQMIEENDKFYRESLNG